MSRVIEHNAENGAGNAPVPDRTAADYMLIEAAAITDAAKRMDQAAFAQAVDLLHRCTGKVVVTGAGTSGIIARKIAATMTSTGSPAMFLHPADAVHGALGIVASGDVLIAVSNGGETDEIIAILPYIRARQVPVVAIVGNPASTIARQAAVALDAHVAREACPLDLAPSASTAVALALGDALALAVSRERQLTPEGFARNHPSGRLGRRLTLRVEDILGESPPKPVVRPDSDWLEIITTIGDGGVGAVLVMDEDGQLEGLITDGDFRRVAVSRGIAGLPGVTAADLMTRTPVVVSADTLAIDALKLMEDRSSQISVLPVVDGDGTCVGLVRVHDIVRSGVL